MRFSNAIMRKKFEACKTQNLNALWAIENLYVPGKSKEQLRNNLEHHMRPIYESVQEYNLWIM